MITRDPEGGAASRGGQAKAFTLIELLVVIAVIALLVTLLMPSLREAKDLARIATCASNLHQWGLATAMYTTDDENGSFPITGTKNIGGTNYLMQAIPTTTGDILMEYVGRETGVGLASCPAMNLYDVLWPDIYEHPTRIMAQYQFMMNFEDPKDVQLATWHNGQQNLTTVTAIVGSPADTAAMSDHHVYLRASYWNVGYSNHLGRAWRSYDPDEIPPGKGLNVLYADSHVRWRNQHETTVNAEVYHRELNRGQYVHWW